MEYESGELGCGFDFPPHYCVHLSFRVCDGDVVHEEKEGTQENQIEKTKRDEEFPVKCEQPGGLRRFFGGRRRGGGFCRFLWQNILERVQHFDSAKGWPGTY